MKVQNIGKALHQAHLQQNRYLARHLEYFKINPRILPFYMVISQSEGLSQKELTEHIGTEKTQTAKAVKQLEKLGYIVRKQDQSDMRFNKLYISPAGLEILPEVKGIINIQDKLICSKYSDRELNKFIEMLETFRLALMENLEVKHENR